MLNKDDSCLWMPCVEVISGWTHCNYYLPHKVAIVAILDCIAWSVSEVGRFSHCGKKTILRKGIIWLCQWLTKYIMKLRINFLILWTFVSGTVSNTFYEFKRMCMWVSMIVCVSICLCVWMSVGVRSFLEIQSIKAPK